MFYVLLYVTLFRFLFCINHDGEERERERELVVLLSLSSWCLLIVVSLFLAEPRVCLQIVVFPDHTHLLFCVICNSKFYSFIFKVGIIIVEDLHLLFYLFFYRPRSAVGNVSGYRCMSDCRSRGREFDRAPYFRGD